MKKVIMGLALPVIAVIGIAASVSATTVTNNAGSNVKISGSCSDMANVASNNKGSNVVIDGGGQCDIKDILKSSAISNNAGSNIVIKNVCGDTSGLVKDNAGSNIQIISSGACKKDEPTTVVVTEKETPKSQAPAEEETMPTALPQTGLGLQSTGLALFAIGGVAYVGAYLVNRSRTV